MSSQGIAAPFPESVSGGAQGEGRDAAGRDIAVDYLRAFVIVLVVFIHAALAYTSFSKVDAARYVDSTAPIVDAKRWPFLDLFVMFFDTSLMSMMFLISGLFTMSALERKGSREFFLARLWRLGIPFIIGALVLAPITYWPAYALADQKTPYLSTFFTSDGWPVGPPWFLWVLLVFGGVVALVHYKAPTVLARLHCQPSVAVIVLATAVSVLSLNLFLPLYWWISLGPFDMQPARLALYFSYFLLGMALGTGQQWRRIGWPGHWKRWFLVGFVSFFVFIIDPIPFPFPISEVLLSVAFAVSCAGSFFGFFGAFRQNVRKRRPVLDSLSANAFGIYLIHYPLVIWMQYALHSASWPAWIKFGIVFSWGVALSWLVTGLLRQSPAVRRIL